MAGIYSSENSRIIQVDIDRIDFDLLDFSDCMAPYTCIVIPVVFFTVKQHDLNASVHSRSSWVWLQDTPSRANRAPRLQQSQHVNLLSPPTLLDLVHN